MENVHEPLMLMWTVCHQKLLENVLLMCDRYIIKPPTSNDLGWVTTHLMWESKSSWEAFEVRCACPSEVSFVPGYAKFTLDGVGLFS